MLKTIRTGFFSTDSLKSRSYTSSKYSVTSEKHRGHELFSTVSDSCQEKRPIDFHEASCGAYAPRCHRKRGQSVGADACAHCAIAIPRLAAGATASVFLRNSRCGFYKTPRLRRSELTYLIHEVLQTDFNNHYFTLTCYKVSEGA